MKTDSEGRLCLNDLHKVAGGEKRHAPAYFIDRVELDELRFELKKANTGIPVQGGVWAHPVCYVLK